MGQLKDFSKLVRSKKDLLTCIFVTLLFQIGISVATMKWDQTHHVFGKDTSFIRLLSILLVLVGLLYAMIIPKLPFFTREALFGVFSIIVGLLLSQLIYIINDPQVVEAAAIATFVNFMLMFALGLFIVYLKYDLEWMGLFLFIALLVLIVSRIFAMFSKNSREINRNISMVAVVLFSLYILIVKLNLLFILHN